MSDSQVIYDLRLKDGLTGGIEKANSAVNTLESSLLSVKTMLTGIGIGAAAFAIGDFIKESGEAWEKMEFSLSQVEAGLKSTQGAAGLTFEELKSGAEKTAHNVKFAQSEILGMQSVLLTFPAVTKETFGDTTDIILDMSTRLGQDLKSSAIQVGKALQDPERGITALRRVGVNFNDTQTELIKNLAETNHMAEAQALILKELRTEFGGSAQAAAEADKSFRLDKTMEENRVAFGEVIDKIKEELMPTLLSIANEFKSLIDWVKRNSSELKVLVKTLAETAIIFKGITLLAVPLAEGLGIIGTGAVTASGGLATLGTEATTLSVTGGPLALLAISIGAIALAYNSMAEASDRARKSEQHWKDEGAKGAKEYIDQQTVIYEKNMKHMDAFEAAKKTYIDKQTKTLSYLEDQINKTAEGSKDRDLYQNLINSTNASIEAARDYKDTPLITNKPPVLPKNNVTDKASSKATGSKSVTINVSIKDLIGTNNINVTNLKESAGKIREVVVNALTGAVNDFQIVAGQ